MPHDCKGKELKTGDVVTFKAKVTEVYPQETACNANFEIIDTDECKEYVPTFTCNTRLAQKENLE